MSQYFIFSVIAITSAFGLYAFIQVLRMARRLSAEREALDSLRNNLQTIHGNDAQVSGSFTDLLKNLPEETEIYRITESVISAKKNGVVIKDKLLDELIHTFRFNDIHFVRKITSFLILIGLIGTLAGLSIGLGDIKFENINEPGEIDKFLGHISAALFSSMVAVGMTVILIIATHYLYEQRRNRFENELSLFFRLELIPVLFPEEKKTDRMADIQQIMTTFAKNASQLVSHSSQSMIEFKQNTADILDAILLNNAQINNLQESISNVYKPFTEIANIQQQMLAISTGIGESVKENRNLISDSKTLISQLSTDASQIIDAVKITESKVDQQTDNISGLVTTMNNLTEEMKKIAGSYMDLLPEFQLIQRNSADYLQQTHSNFNKVLNEINSKFITTLDKIEEKTISDVSLPIKQNVDYLIKKLDEAIDKLNTVIVNSKENTEGNAKLISEIKALQIGGNQHKQNHTPKGRRDKQNNQITFRPKPDVSGSPEVHEEDAKTEIPPDTEIPKKEEKVDHETRISGTESINDPQETETTNPEQRPEGIPDQEGITEQGGNQEEEHPENESSRDSGGTDSEPFKDPIKSGNPFFRIWNKLNPFNRN